MKEVVYRIVQNRKIAHDVFEMRLTGDTSAVCTPGQFVDLAVDGCYLRRPLSVCDRTEQGLTLIYKVVGKGTEILSGMQTGKKLNALAGLGNGFHVDAGGERPLLVGGGVGVPPMYWLCRELISAGKKPTVVLGFNQAEDVFYAEEFERIGARVCLTTADGSMGIKGFVTDAVKELDYTYFYACGPEPMFRALDAVVTTAGEYSFESRMGCGFGACMGCSCKTKYGYKRICRDGPVLRREEVIW